MLIFQDQGNTFIKIILFIVVSVLLQLKIICVMVSPSLIFRCKPFLILSCYSNRKYGSIVMIHNVEVKRKTTVTLLETEIDNEISPKQYVHAHTKKQTFKPVH